MQIYIALNRTAPLTRSMHQVLLKQLRRKQLSCVGRWHCGDPYFAVHPTVNSKLLAQPRQRHDDHTYPAGTLRPRASCGWLNGDAVVQRLRNLELELESGYLKTLYSCDDCQRRVPISCVGRQASDP